MTYLDREAAESQYYSIGMKGCGEVGTVGASAIDTNPEQNAVRECDLRDVQMPFTPHRAWKMLSNDVAA